jgi:hypothetical protein
MTSESKKTRAEREAELQRLWTQPGGRAEVIELFLQATGSPADTIPSLARQVFKAILAKEFPAK